jgi:hypothetical protein
MDAIALLDRLGKKGCIPEVKEEPLWQCWRCSAEGPLAFG